MMRIVLRLHACMAMSSASLYRAQLERARQQHISARAEVSGPGVHGQQVQAAEGGEDLEQNIDSAGVRQPGALLRQRWFRAGGRQQVPERYLGGVAQGVASRQVAPASADT